MRYRQVFFVIIYITIILVASIATAWYIKTPSPLRTLEFFHERLTNAAVLAIAGNLTLVPSGKAQQFPVPESVESLGIDTIAVDSGVAVFHVRGSALLPFDEYLVYDENEVHVDLSDIDYLKPPSDYRLKEVTKRGKWRYAKYEQIR